jgi:hypothetical protein
MHRRAFWVRVDQSEYTYNMDYSAGSRIRVRLYSGKVVEAEITAITNQSTGRKLQIVYGNVTASINPAQITEVLPATSCASKSKSAQLYWFGCTTAAKSKPRLRLSLTVRRGKKFILRQDPTR